MFAINWAFGVESSGIFRVRDTLGYVRDKRRAWGSTAFHLVVVGVDHEIVSLRYLGVGGSRIERCRISF